MLWLILWSLLCGILFYYYCIRPMNYWKKRGIKQSNPGWIFGDQTNMILKKESLIDIVIRLYKQHPNERLTIFHFLNYNVIKLRMENIVDIFSNYFH